MPLPLVPLGMKLFGLFAGINWKKALEFLMKYWKQILVGAMATVIIYQNVFETRFFFGFETIPSLERRLSESQDSLDKAIAGNRALSAAIDDNNDRIAEYEKLANELQGKIATLNSKLEDEREKVAKEVEEILKDTTPKSCEESMQYLRDAKEDLKW